MKAKKGRKKKAHKHSHKQEMNGFNVNTVLQANPDMERRHLVCLAGASLAGGALGIVTGRPSFGIGAFLAGLGIWQKNAYLSAAGGSMAIACIPDYMKDQPVKGIREEINGFDIKKIAEGMKDRAGLLWDNLSYKLYLPQKTGATTTTNKTANGLNGGEKVTYFVNPYNQQNRQPDFSELNKVTAEIEASYGNKNVEGTDDESMEGKNF